MPENKSEIWCLSRFCTARFYQRTSADLLGRSAVCRPITAKPAHLKNRSALQASALRAHAKQPPGTKKVTSDQWRVTSREHERRVPFPVLGPLAVPPTLPHFVYPHTYGGG